MHLIVCFSLFIREHERVKKRSQAADVLAPSNINFNEFYKGGGKRTMVNNVERRDLMSDNFMNRNGGGGQYNEFMNVPMVAHASSYPASHDQYEMRSMSGGRSRSRSRRRYYYSSDESTPERIRHRRRRKHYRDSEKRSESPLNDNTKQIVKID